MAPEHYFFLTIFLVYLVWTLLFAIKFHRSTTIFTKRQKLVHSILIWLIPFIWIFALKTIFESSPGSHHYPNKRSKNQFTDNGLNSWSDSGGDDGGEHH